MKLIRFGEVGAERPGIMVNGSRKDCSAFFSDWDRSFFQRGGLAQLRALLAEEGHLLPDVPETARWAAPIARPGMIMCIGLNYSDHAKESGMEVPAEPLIFGKASNTLSGPYDSVAIPKGSEKTDWEVELGVVLGKDVSYLASEAEAEAAIVGYCVVNDLSERDFQLARGGQWIKGKSCPGFSPVGPYLVTADEVRNPLNLGMQLKVNGETMQSGNTATMVFSPAHLVWYLSQHMLVEAGDLISTGTPPGVGLGQDPPRYLKAGDEVELSIDGLGTQRQRFV
ncbi:MAG: FAA hydrolase family protein [Bacteroidetes bacterium]|nr:MAG: FAA hydrolase family protein [Bacteroidota bacterium]